MSRKRSGLLPGLVLGLVTALVCSACLGAAVLFQRSLPEAVTGFWSGLPLSLGLSVLIALLVALAIGAVRPRSLLLVPLAALYAGGAVVAGQIAGVSIMIGAPLRTPPAEPRAAQLSDVTVANFTEGLPGALALYRQPLAEAWAVWLYIAVAALVSLLLVTFRVTRVRRAHRAESEATEQATEPEYRAPFEPAQQPAQKPAPDLFTPRNPTQD
ncbi:hypothetical protein SAMN05421874_10835 [Nonomuraea maritima]|uniref:Uncharacterized protein n=1 Tax=Nonomuraea maritima TaxID=683260 RepID=A0A1G9CAJ7_9ACTN|nr:hypothetical protein [Nonomuraea maritima]SDK48692.1 hypothetical protein SAMN05421874_10835 [Nonomuraea maritima]